MRLFRHAGLYSSASTMAYMPYGKPNELEPRDMCVNQMPGGNY